MGDFAAWFAVICLFLLVAMNFESGPLVALLDEP